VNGSSVQFSRRPLENSILVSISYYIFVTEEAILKDVILTQYRYDIHSQHTLINQKISSSRFLVEHEAQQLH
jgi:hypothetical protein